ncbi:hypothetical protein J3Q64DRAFT_1693408 [Phycomyces blakesleeanus]|uniref:Uncharacterized protein n=1 Tax=Phycomyces blakesleeanus TaxID=4837 RepID=A0ABR3BDS5_PHYBL
MQHDFGHPVGFGEVKPGNSSTTKHSVSLDVLRLGIASKRAIDKWKLNSCFGFMINGLDLTCQKSDDVSGMNFMLLMLREMMKLVLSQYPNYMHCSAGLATEHLVPRLDIELQLITTIPFFFHRYCH